MGKDPWVLENSEEDHRRRSAHGETGSRPSSPLFAKPVTPCGLWLGTSDIKSADTLHLPLMRAGGPQGNRVTFADHTIIRQSWRTGKGNCVVSGVKIRKTKTKT